MEFDTAYENYYAILNSSYCAEGMDVTNIPDSSAESLISETNNLFNSFVNMVSTLEDYERKKEEAYLMTWINKLEKGTDERGKSLKDLLLPLIKEKPTNFTQAFQLIELWRQGFIQSVSSIRQIYEDWQKEFEQYSNKFIKTTAEKIVAELGERGELMTLTPPQFMNKIIEGLKQEWYSRFSKDYPEANFLKFLDKFEPYLTQIIQDMKVFKQKSKENIISLWDSGKTLDKLFKIKDPKDLTKTISEKIVTGLINGLSQEITLVAFGEGASTARAMRELKFLNGKVMNLATETDVYAILNFDLTPDSEITNQIANFDKDTDIQNLIKSTDVKEHFIIHYSSKDLTIAEAGTANPAAKIKGEGGLGSKVIGLQEMGRSAGKETEVHELIFKAINIGYQLLYEKHAGNLTDKISDALTALTFSFMFDDFERQFEQIRGKAEAQGTELNLYMVSGQYYPASEILRTLKQYVLDLQDPNKIVKKKFIDIGFKPSSLNVVDTIKAKRSRFSGDKLWAEVRDAVLGDAKMKILMATSYLKELANAIQDGV